MRENGGIRGLGLVARTRIVSGLLAALLGLVFVLLAGAVTHLQDTNRAARRAGDVLAGANQLDRTVLDLQIGLQGYVTTRDLRFLKPYEEARASFAPNWRRVHDLITVPEQRARFEEINRGVSRYLRGYAEPLVARTQARRATLEEVSLRTRQGGRLIQELRAQFDVFLVVEERILAQRRRRVDREGDRAVVLGFAGAALTLIMLAGLARLVGRRVAMPVVEVAGAARRVAGGDLTVRVPESGAAEIAQLSSSFNEMAIQLERSSRIKDEFFALVSHELRTPLTSIVGYTEVLRDDLEEAGSDPMLLKHVSRIQRGATRLTRLVGDLLFVAEIEAGKLSIRFRDGVDLGAVTALSVDGLRHRAVNQGLELEADTAPAVVRGDADRLGQVVDNLLSNAIKFTPTGGRVWVQLASQDGSAVLTIRDSGIGIPLDEQPRLFERFFRASTATRGEIQGVGLGLSIVRAVVEAHGGTIDLESEPGVGTTFHVRIPLQRVDDHETDEGSRDGAR